MTVSTGPEVAKDWYANIGGFSRVSDGLRAPQYKLDQGGQLTAALKHVTDKGTFMLWRRVLSEKNLLLKQVPIIQAPDGVFHACPGFNPLIGICDSRAIQHSQVPSPRGGLQGVNLADGRGANMRYLGANYDTTVGDWTLSDRILCGNGHPPTVALFPGSNPQPLIS